jgi:hypothetical protein|tara:strand:- start:289 stop:534 length:246 start_codon:yes stop_codon:yes gene_type:complete
MNNDDTHDKIIKAVLEYFALNEIFQQRPAELKRRKVRKKLGELRDLCKVRRDEIMEEHIRHIEDGRKNNNPEKAREALKKK